MSVPPPPPLYVDPPPADGEAAADSVLVRAVTLRFPNLKPEGLGLTGSQKSELLMDHIGETAIVRGELAELRLEAHAQLLTSEVEWEAILVTEAGSLAAKERAREKARPALARTRRQARWTIDRCTEEMERMDADYNSASRAYTILSGS